MSVNLPTSSGNEEVLRVASTITAHGKFGVAQQMHTHSGFFYGPDYHGPEFYGIVPLFDMNAKTGATALVPGSHLKVDDINAYREEHWQTRHQRPEWTEDDRLAFAADLECFRSNGLEPVVTNVHGGDCVLFGEKFTAFPIDKGSADASGSGAGLSRQTRARFTAAAPPRTLPDRAVTHTPTPAGEPEDHLLTERVLGGRQRPG